MMTPENARSLRAILFVCALALAASLHASRVAYYNFQKGTDYFREGDYPLAAQFYRATIREKFDLWEAHYNLGLCLYYMEKPAEALEYLRKALRFNPENVRVKSLVDMIEAQMVPTTISVIDYYDYGLELLKAKDYANAVKYLEYYTSVNQENPQAYYHLGVCYHALRLPQKAGLNFGLALDIKSNHKETLDFLKLKGVYMGMLAERFEVKEADMPQRRPLLAAVLSLAPGGGQIYNRNKLRAILYFGSTVSLIGVGSYLDRDDRNEKAAQALKTAGITVLAVNIVDAAVTATLFNRKARIDYYRRKDSAALQLSVRW